MAKKSTKLEAMRDILQREGITPDSIKNNDGLIRELKKNADAIPDYRHPSYTRHPLGDVVMIAFFALLGNANEWGEIESFARRKEKWSRKYLELPNGVPTDDTIRIVIGNIDTGHFFQVVVQLLLNTVDGVSSLSETETHERASVAVDGKESRGSKRNETSTGRSGHCRP